MKRTCEDPGTDSIMQRSLTCGFSLLIAAMVIYLAGMGASAATKSEEGEGYIAAAEQLWQRLSGATEPGFRFGAGLGGNTLVYEIDTGWSLSARRMARRPLSVCAE
jgi:hypothetical protein